MTETGEDAAHRGETVVVLHGLATPHFQMGPVRRALARAGYRVVYVRYPSRRHGIEQIASSYIAPQVNEAAGVSRKPVHFVAYSMGGVVLRQYLARDRPDGLRPGNLVFIACPHHGTEIVEGLRRWRILSWYYGPAYFQLGTGRGNITATLPAKPPGRSLCIYGNRSINPLGSYLFKRPHDGTVPAERARLEGAETLELQATHPGILYRRETLRAMLRFLADGTLTGGPGATLGSTRSP